MKEKTILYIAGGIAVFVALNYITKNKISTDAGKALGGGLGNLIEGTGQGLWDTIIVNPWKETIIQPTTNYFGWIKSLGNKDKWLS